MFCVLFLFILKFFVFHFSLHAADVELLVATQSGIIATGFGPDSSSRCVDRDSSGSIGVAVDAYTDTTYWVTDGSVASVVSLNVAGTRSMTPDEVNNGFSLRLDWVTRRLFWVQDQTQGSTVRCC